MLRDEGLWRVIRGWKFFPFLQCEMQERDTCQNLAVTKNKYRSIHSKTKAMKNKFLLLVSHRVCGI